MKIRFESSDATIRSLYRWLRDDRELRRDLELTPVTEAHADEMGGALDAVLATLSTGAAVGQLALAIAAWREAKKPRSEVTITLHGGDTTDLEALLRALGKSPGASENVDDRVHPEPGPDDDPSEGR